MSLYDKRIPLKYQPLFNGKSAQENYTIQKKRIKYERELENNIYSSIMSMIDGSAGELERDMANNVGLCLERVFAGGEIHPEELKHMSFSKTLAIGLGTAIGSIPGLLLDDILEDE